MFQRAQKKKSKLRLSISGLPGSGKTWSALEIATGMGGRIALIDTEAGRANLYGDNFVYDAFEISAPFSPDKYIQGIKGAEREGYDILIIDSLSHAWSGDGGVLSIAEREGGQFQTGWKKATPQHNALVEAIVQSKMHIISTMRSKVNYVVELNEKGKHAPRKVGLAPIQREGLEYEMTICMEINETIAYVSKDNTQLFNQQHIKPSKLMGEELIQWLNFGISPEDEFKEKIIPKILNDISQTRELDSLRNLFMDASRKFSSKFPDQFLQIIEAKDNQKEFISGNLRNLKSMLNDLENEGELGDDL